MYDCQGSNLTQTDQKFDENELRRMKKSACKHDEVPWHTYLNVLIRHLRRVVDDVASSIRLLGL